MYEMFGGLFGEQKRRENVWKNIQKCVSQKASWVFRIKDPFQEPKG